MTKANMPWTDRFWAKVDKEQTGTGCWEWASNCHPDGYGQFTRRPETGTGRAHRIAYELLVGPIPPGLVIDHLCRNRACVNPAHLEPVTNEENLRRGLLGMPQKLRTHCSKGHEFTDANTNWVPQRSGRLGRQCRACKIMYTVRWDKAHPERVKARNRRADAKRRLAKRLARAS